MSTAGTALLWPERNHNERILADAAISISADQVPNRQSFLLLGLGSALAMAYAAAHAISMFPFRLKQIDRITWHP